MTAEVTQLGYIGIGVSDVAEWERFATEVLGLEVVGHEADGTLLLRNDDYHHRFAIHPNGPDDVLYQGWETSSEADLKEIRARLEAAGVAVTSGTAAEAAERHVKGLIKLQDPNGLPTEVFYGAERTTPFVSPRGQLISFEADDQGFGHSLLMVEDNATTEHFYRDLLGMKLSDYIRTEPVGGFALDAVFLHCNPRHHSLAFAKGRPGGKRLNHFMIQVQSIDAVGETYDICAQRGLFGSSIGRHTNDQMVSFYMPTPSGFQIEYGFGAREIDDATWQPEVHNAASTWGHKRVQVPQPVAG